MKNLRKINFFDYLIIILILSLFLFFLIRLFRKTTQIEIVLKIYREEWFLQQLKPGMAEKNILGKKMAEILSIKTYPTGDQKKWSHLKIKLKAVYSPGENSYVYKAKKILIGSDFEFYPNNLLVDGTIIKINDKNKDNNLYQIKAKGRLINNDPSFPNTEGVDEYIANSIEEGSIMTDSLNFPAVKINKKDILDAKMVTVDAFGQTYLKTNPLRKDVFVDLTIWAEKKGDYYYLFGDESFPIIIGNSIPFTSENNWVFFTITEIKEIKKIQK
ncbi:MAG: hypothetical protein ACK4FL_02820 [Microgenomates group bacterium]